MTPLSKEQLRVEMERFLADEDKGISVTVFAEACGLSKDTINKVFLSRTRPLTEMVQARVNRGYAAWKAGLLRTMKRRDNTVFADYRKKPEVPILPSSRLTYENGSFRLKIGLQNRHDYSNPSLKEQLSKRG